MTRRRNSAKARRVCFLAHSREDRMGVYLACHCCGRRIDAVRESQRWRADHIRRWAEGGEDEPENLWPICTDCDREKAPNDARQVAKGKRQRDRRYGLKKQALPFPGSRASKWKRHMDGTVSRRDI